MNDVLRNRVEAICKVTQSLSEIKRRINEKEREINQLMEERHLRLAGFYTDRNQDRTMLLTETLKVSMKIDSQVESYKDTRKEWTELIAKLNDFVSFGIAKKELLDEMLRNMNIVVAAIETQMNDFLNETRRRHDQAGNVFRSLVAEIEQERELRRENERALIHQVQMEFKLLWKKIESLEPRAQAKKESDGIEEIERNIAGLSGPEENGDEKPDDEPGSDSGADRSPSPQRKKRRIDKSPSVSATSRSRSIANERKQTRKGSPSRCTDVVRRILRRGTDSNETVYTRCAFCKKSHHSNECGEVPFIEDRERIIERAHKCRRCLNRHRERCRRIGPPCSFCRKMGRDSSHHAALCPIPRNRYYD